MAKDGRNLWRSTCPTFLLKQGHLELVAWDHVQSAFEYFKKWRLYDANHLIKMDLQLRKAPENRSALPRLWKKRGERRSGIIFCNERKQSHCNILSKPEN